MVRRSAILDVILEFTRADQAIEKVRAKLKTLGKTLDASFRGGQTIQQSVQNINRPLQQAAKSSNTLKASLNDTEAAARRLGVSMKSLGNLQKSGQPLGRITGQADEFTKSLEASNARVIAFAASAGLILKVQQAFAALLDTTIQVEKQLKDINVIFGLNEDQLNSFGKTLFNIAGQTGQAFNTVAEAAAEFARQGLSVTETSKRLADALILSRLAGSDAVESVESLTAIINTFNDVSLDSTKIINKLANVDAAFAVSVRDLSEAFKRVGSTAIGAKVTFDELNGIIAALQQTTARGGAVIGNALRTIFVRIERPDTLKQLRELGIATNDLVGETLPALQILRQLADTYDTLNSAQRSNIVQTVAGVRQGNILKALLSDLSRESSNVDKALRKSADATDEANRRNQELNETISAVINNTVQQIKGLSFAFGELSLEPAIRQVFTGLDRFVNAIKKVAEAETVTSTFVKTLGESLLKGLGAFLSGPGLAVIGIFIFKLSKDLAVFALNAFKQIQNLNSGAAKQAELQKRIGNIIASHPRLLNQILAGNISIEQTHRDILTLMTAEQRIAERIQALSIGTAASITKTIGGSRNLTKTGGILSGANGNLSVSPNIGSAINREIAAGVPRTSIRLSSSPLLSTSNNPGGLAVTNIRDEPRGLKSIIPNFAASTNPYELIADAGVSSAKLGIDVLSSFDEIAKKNKDFASASEQLRKKFVDGGLATSEQFDDLTQGLKNNKDSFQILRQRIDDSSDLFLQQKSLLIDGQKRLKKGSSFLGRAFDKVSGANERFGSRGVGKFLGKAGGVGGLLSSFLIQSTLAANPDIAASRAGKATSGAVTGATIGASLLGPFGALAGAIIGITSAYTDLIKQTKVVTGIFDKLSNVPFFNQFLLPTTGERNKDGSAVLESDPQFRFSKPGASREEILRNTRRNLLIFQQRGYYNPQANKIEEEVKKTDSVIPPTRFEIIEAELTKSISSQIESFKSKYVEAIVKADNELSQTLFQIDAEIESIGKFGFEKINFDTLKKLESISINKLNDLDEATQSIFNKVRLQAVDVANNLEFALKTDKNIDALTDINFDALRKAIINVEDAFRSGESSPLSRRFIIDTAVQLEETGEAGKELSKSLTKYLETVDTSSEEILIKRKEIEKNAEREAQITEKRKSLVEQQYILSERLNKRLLDAAAIEEANNEARRALISSELEGLNQISSSELATSLRKASQARIRSEGINKNNFGSIFQERFQASATEAFGFNNVDLLDQLDKSFVDLFSTLKGGLSDSLVDVALNAKDASTSFRELADSILRATTKQGINSLINVLIGSAFKASQGSGGIGQNANGGLISRFAGGGPVIGGSGIRDDVPAMLQEGEYVLRKSAVNKIGRPALQRLNNGGFSTSVNLSNEFNPLTNRLNISPLLSSRALQLDINRSNQFRSDDLKTYLDYIQRKDEARKIFEQQKKGRRNAALVSAISNIISYGAGRAGAGGGSTFGPQQFSQSNYTVNDVTKTGYKFNRGGMVPSLLTGGEYIIDKQTTNRVGPEVLDILNRGRFANGGNVGVNSGVSSGDVINNFEINVNTNGTVSVNQVSTEGDSTDRPSISREKDRQEVSKQLGIAIQQKVYETINQQKRPGGLLDPRRGY